jgi:hypothetical protein
MNEFFKGAFTAPVANLLIVAGFILVLITVIARYRDEFHADRPGRIFGGIVGVVLMVVGVAIHLIGSFTSSGLGTTPGPVETQLTQPAGNTNNNPTHQPVPLPVSTSEDCTQSVQAQTIKGVTVLTAVHRETGYIVLTLHITNANNRGVFWGWAPKRGIVYFGNKGVDIPSTAPAFSVEAGREVDTEITISEDYDTCPTAMDLTSWALADKANPTFPEFQEWKYSFEFNK